MRQIPALSGRGFLGLVCSLLVVFQPVLGAQDTVTTVAALQFLSGAPADPAPELIAVAKVSGTADRNGEPLANGSIIASGDSLRTHGNSALLLASTPEVCSAGVSFARASNGKKGIAGSRGDWPSCRWHDLVAGSDQGARTV